MKIECWQTFFHTGCFILQCHLNTVWKFRNFSITKILREINFGDSSSANSAILTHLEAPNFDFFNICTFWRVKFTKSTNFREPKTAKTAVLQLPHSPKLISHKIWMKEKSRKTNLLLQFGQKLKFCTFKSHFAKVILKLDMSFWIWISRSLTLYVFP